MTAAGYSQPSAPVGLPTGNPWDLAYPFGQAPPPLKREGAASTDEGPGYIGQQVEDLEPAAEVAVTDDESDGSDEDAAAPQQKAPAAGRRRTKES